MLANLQAIYPTNNLHSYESLTILTTGNNRIQFLFILNVNDIIVNEKINLNTEV